jgi:hypothetical protein
LKLAIGGAGPLVRCSGRDGVGESLAAAALNVDGDMDCDTGFTAHGQVTLRGAPIAGRLTFKGAVLKASGIAVWPSEIWLNGFTYDTIRHRTGRVPVTERLDWVSRGPLGYQPQQRQQPRTYHLAGLTGGACRSATELKDDHSHVHGDAHTHAQRADDHLLLPPDADGTQ